jgi:prephenate dehydratase
VTRIAYFGPTGTFSEQAALAFADGQELIPAETIPLAFAAVRAGDAEFACVPIENSVEGSVSATMDALAADAPLIAIAEVVLPVRFSVLVRPGTTEVGTVASHPHALAQVRHWLAEHLPDAAVVAATSTAAAAVGVAEGRFDAAVSAPVAVQHYPLDELATDVADVRDAVTRFLLLCKPGALPAPTGADRTSVVAVAADRPGELAGIMSELALRSINVSRIESRPTKERLGEYKFYLDIDGHIAQQRVGDALAALHRRCHDVRFLGSYPQAVPRAGGADDPDTSDGSYAAAAEWLADVREGTGA